MCYERVHTDIRYIIPYIVTVFRVFILIFEKELEVLVETVLRTGPHCQTTHLYKGTVFRPVLQEHFQHS